MQRSFPNNDDGDGSNEEAATHIGPKFEAPHQDNGGIERPDLKNPRVHPPVPDGLSTLSGSSGSRLALTSLRHPSMRSPKEEFKKTSLPTVPNHDVVADKLGHYNSSNGTEDNGDDIGRAASGEFTMPLHSSMHVDDDRGRAPPPPVNNTYAACITGRFSLHAIKAALEDIPEDCDSVAAEEILRLSRASSLSFNRNSTGNLQLPGWNVSTPVNPSANGN